MLDDYGAMGAAILESKLCYWACSNA